MYRVIKGLLISVFVVMLTACGGRSGGSGVGDPVRDNLGVEGDTTPSNVRVPKVQTLKKTGQTTSYYAKDDGDYQQGTTPSYTRNDVINIVTDHVTGLMWQDNVEAKTMRKNWVDAQSYCSALGLDGGGWRLPTRKELVGLSDYSRRNPAVNLIFVNTASDRYWSSTIYATSFSSAWSVYFYNGGQYSDSMSNSNYVRCVRVRKT